MSDRMDVAREGWGGAVPDWVEALVKACDQSSQTKVARRVGYTAAVVSQVIRNSYPARREAIEDRVRAIYLDGLIDCPALGELSAEACLHWRDRANKLTSSSPAIVRMFRACSKCPRHARSQEEDET